MQTKKLVNKKVVLYISDSHHSDIVYADLLNLLISYQDEKVIFREKSYIDRLCKIINHTQGNEKENSRKNKGNEEDIQTNIESKALECIKKNIVLIINLNSLHTYYQWVSFYPNLEKLCSTRFINDSLKEKESFEGSAVARMTDQKEVVSSGNFIEKSIKEFAKREEEQKQERMMYRRQSKDKINEKVIFEIKEEPCLALKSDNRLGGSVSTKLTSDKMQIFKDPECFNMYPQEGAVTDEFYSEARFKNFVETFNKLFDVIKGKLLRSRTFNQRYKERCEKILEIYINKGFVKESYNCSSNSRKQLANAASLNERIEELHAKVKEKEALIKLKMKISKEAYENKKILKAEIQDNIDDRMDKLNRILSAIENCSKRDMNQVPQSYDRLKENERKIVEILLHIIFLKQVPDAKFSSFVGKTLAMITKKDKIVAILRARRDTNFNEATVGKIKAFTQRYGDDKFDKPVFRHIAKYLQGLVKKFNLKVMLESRYEKLERMNETLIQSELEVSNYRNLVEDYKEELEDLIIKQKNQEDDLKRQSKSISEEEARNEQIYKEITQSLKKAEGKLVKSKIRMKNLFGDCLMLSASINY